METPPAESALRTLPIELWIVIALLGVAGGLIAWPVLPVVPDALTGLADAGEFLPFAVLITGLLLGMLFLSFSCFWLALSLYQVDPVGRLLGIVGAASLALALLIGPGSDATETLVILAGAAIVVLLLTPGVSRRFAGESEIDGAPMAVVGARALLIVQFGLLGFFGVVFLPFVSLDTALAIKGVVLIAMSVAGFRASSRLATGQPQARILASALMVGYIVTLLFIGRRHPALLVPIGFALSVVLLLWAPRSSRNLFTPPGTPVPEPVARWNAFAERVQVNLAGAGAFALIAGDGGGVQAPASPEVPLPTFAPTPTRKSVDEFRTQVIPAGSWTAGSLVPADELELHLDSRSWFPQVQASEPVVGRWSASVTAPTDDFRGRSTLVVTSARLAGVCAHGQAGVGPLDPQAGPTLAWSVGLDAGVVVDLAASTDGGQHLAISFGGAGPPQLYVTDARLWHDGAFQPGDIVHLAAVIEATATSSGDRYP